MQSPLFQHNCQDCKYLATFKDKDLYFCSNHGVPIVKARFSDKVKDVEKGLGLVKSEALEVAQALSLRKGLVTPTEVEGAKTKKVYIEEAISATKRYGMLPILTTDTDILQLASLPLRRCIVSKLVMDPDFRVREVIALRKDLLEDEIKKLSLDISPWVRGEIAQRSGLSRQIISNLLKDPSDRVLKIILRNQAVPAEIVYSFSFDITGGDGNKERKKLDPWNSDLSKKVKDLKKISRDDLYKGQGFNEPFLFVENMNWGSFPEFFFWKEWDSPTWNFGSYRYSGLNLKKEWAVGAVTLPQEMDGFLEAGDLYTFPSSDKTDSPSNKERLETPITVGLVEVDGNLGFWVCPIRKLQEKITYLECFPEFSWKKKKEINVECLGIAMGGTAEGKGKGLLALWGIDKKAVGWTSEERADKIPKYRLLRQEDLIPKFWEPKLKSLEEIEKKTIGQELAL